SMESSYGLGAIIGGAFIAWWGGMENRMTMSLIAAVGLGVLMVALGFASYWVFVILLFAWGLVGPLYDTPFVTLLQERVEPDMHGRVFGFLQVVIAASIPLGMMLFGPLADIVPIEYIYIVCGLLIIVLAAFARYGLKLEEI
ncbi:MAG: MFS transporter, partial [Coriobacteriia bacterium]|nr:MFS transporter [Coriobacteriia bacterium]